LLSASRSDLGYPGSNASMASTVYAFRSAVKTDTAQISMLFQAVGLGSFDQ